MDAILSIEYDPRSLLNGIEYLMGLHRNLTNYRLILINIDSNPYFSQEGKEYYENNDMIIPENNILKKIHFNYAKAKAIDKLNRLYESLCWFINTKCRFNSKFKISASTLLRKFSQEINEEINNNIEFPTLMKRLLENNNNIIKQSTSKGIVYKGIDLKPDERIYDSENNYISVVEQKNNVSTEIPINQSDDSILAKMSTEQKNDNISTVMSINQENSAIFPKTPKYVCISPEYIIDSQKNDYVTIPTNINFNSNI